MHIYMSTHSHTMQYTYNVLYTELSDTSLGLYVFVPMATAYSPQTDHLSNTAAIQGCWFVCLCLWQCCRQILLPPARLQPPSGPSSLSSISTSFNPSPMARNLPLNVPPPFHPFTFVVIPLIPVFTFPFFFLRPFSSQLHSLPFMSASSFFFFPSFRPPASDSVRSRTQYRIDWFPSVFSDLAVIVPERSRQIDFSEKDTVMFGNLWLHRAN